MQDPRLDNRTRYNRLARGYEALVRFGSFGQLGRFHRAVAEALDPVPGGTILDLGCGPAPLTPWLLPKVGPDGSVLGFDVADRMIERAREIAAREGWLNARFERADVSALALPEGVDAVVFCLSLTTMPDCEGCLRRALAALAPGGQLVILDSLPDPSRRLAGLVIRLKSPLVGARPTSAPLDVARAALEDLAVRHFHLGIYSLISGRKPAAA